LTDEIVDLGTRYGIVTPYTSYLALEPGAVTETITVTGNTARRADSNRVFSRQARDLPSKTRPKSAASGTGGGAPMPEAAMPVMLPTPAPTPLPTTGAAAVKDSKRAREQQEQLRVVDGADEDRSAQSVMRKVADKTFYLRDGVWTDADFKTDAKLPETTLVFGSDAYFELLQRERKLAEFFALGERVVVVYKGRVYRVNAATN
jgi:Ca-activated chloride channel family protein